MRSRKGSAVALISRHAARVSESAGVLIGAPKAKRFWMSGRGTSFCGRRRKYRCSCHARWPTIQLMQFICPWCVVASASETPASARSHSSRVKRSCSTRGCTAVRRARPTRGVLRAVGAARLIGR
jgi:hypothetical protein